MKLKLLSAALLFSITAQSQVATINENFSTFSGQTFPQQGWTSSKPYPYALFSVNNFPQVYSGTDVINPTYIITPELIAIDGTQTLKFDAQISTGSFQGAAGTIEVGTIASPSDTSSFVSISSPVALQSTSSAFSYTIPATTAKFIAFKIKPSTVHSAFQIDNVVFSAASNLGVGDQTKSKENIQFTVNPENTTLQFTTKKELKNIQIYSSNAQKVKEGKVMDKAFDISNLQTGIYYFTIESAEGSIMKSTFIKK
ncbi:T9SS type A sorting domain-containing protein [Chryseobacterium potabilaquae]|uniref:Secretion system C-terminal sorting domain-containing protein n=1 Tax=Chryseobacterium potabilaquae TaxID=2675057 RepID=A0A6N4X2L8_9FLAO|nr:T9SS type A sorting domain-containing protein [Chryseobacterium potabilaquae]CAA7193621.1 hypothetical protein CHRY9293_00033 [Chryseobacterium potabilaquae]